MHRDALDEAGASHQQRWTPFVAQCAGPSGVRGWHPCFFSSTRRFFARPSIQVAENIPDDLSKQLDQDCHVALYGVYFDFNKATLRPDSDPTLQKVLAFLSSVASVATGTFIPYPCAVMRLLEIPFAVSHVTTACARSSESLRL
jgi:hypothetical protein